MTPKKIAHLLADFVADCLHEEMAGSPTEAIQGATWAFLYDNSSIAVYQEEDSPNQVFIEVNGQAYQVSITRDRGRDTK